MKQTAGKTPLILGIVNATPDSFSDGGAYDPVEHAADLVAAGADALDVGGESTRPGFTEVPVEEELRRVMPVVTKLRMLYPKLPISVDTRKSRVAAAALEAGADWINDVSGGSFDPEILKVTAAGSAVFIIGHDSRLHHSGSVGGGIADEILACWRELFSRAFDAGIKPENIMVDPGFGFGKSVSENLEIVRDFRKLAAGSPADICVGVSRKRFLGPERAPLERAEATGRLEAELAAAGARVIRTHDPGALLETMRERNMAERS